MSTMLARNAARPPGIFRPRKKLALVCNLLPELRVFQLDQDNVIELEDVELCLHNTRTWKNVDAKRKYFESHGVDFDNVRGYYHLVKRYNKLVTTLDKNERSGLATIAMFKGMIWALRANARDMLVWSWMAFAFIVSVLLDEEKTYSNNVLPFSARRINNE